MASHKAHALLSEIHRLLSSYSESEFLEAMDMSPQMGELLISFAHHAPKKKSELRVPQEDFRSYSTSSIHSEHSRSAAQDDIYALLRDSVYADSANSISALAERLGIHVNYNAKDSKDRLLRRLASAIASLPREDRSRILIEISQASQSEGWIDVIKSGRR